MSDQVNGSGSVSANSTVNPGDATQTNTDLSTIQSELAEVKKKYQESEGNLQKVRDFYAANPDLITFARKYSEDSKAAELVRNYLNGKVSTAPNEGKAEDDLADMPEAQRNLVMKLVEKKLEEYTGAIKADVGQLRNAQLQSQINGWRAAYNKQTGWPVDFKEVEPKIAEMLQKGEAVNAEGAYRQIAADYLLKDRVQKDREIKDLKVKASMSRASVPSQLASRGKAEAKTMAEAMAEAIEELGIES